MAETRSIIGEIQSVDYLSANIFDDTDDLELQQRLEKIE
jgi:hypothetical protein